MVKHIALTITIAALLACGGERPARPANTRPASPLEVSTPSGGGDIPSTEPPGQPATGQDGVGPHLAAGQTLYVPVYSHVYWGPKARAFNLACTLSIRNVDLSSAITVFAVDYYDTAGSLVRSHLDAPVVLRPLQTVDYYIEERDATGGSGANFIVRWRSDRAVNVPVVETLMIGVYSSQGISFVCPARAISE
jgi:hypothetical protein